MIRLSRPDCPGMKQTLMAAFLCHCSLPVLCGLPGGILFAHRPQRALTGFDTLKGLDSFSTIFCLACILVAPRYRNGQGSQLNLSVAIIHKNFCSIVHNLDSFVQFFCEWSKPPLRHTLSLTLLPLGLDGLMAPHEDGYEAVGFISASNCFLAGMSYPIDSCRGCS